MSNLFFILTNNTTIVVYYVSNTLQFVLRAKYLLEPLQCEPFAIGTYTSEIDQYHHQLKEEVHRSTTFCGSLTLHARDNL